MAKRPALWGAIKRRVLERDGMACRYCGKAIGRGDLNFDHMLPVSRGGRNIDANIVVSCRRCNTAKRDRTPEEFSATKATMVPVRQIASIIGADVRAVVAACRIAKIKMVRSHESWLVAPGEAEKIGHMFDDVWG